MATICAIDPGAEQSAFVLWDGKEILDMGIYPNKDLLNQVDVPAVVHWVIEKIESYGMPVGRSIFDTVYWTGVFASAIGVEKIHWVTRRHVKLHICEDSRAKDSNIRQALIDRFGRPGKKTEPGITYGLKKDLWQAFALAVTFGDSL